MVQDVTLYVQANGPGNWAVLNRVGPDPVIGVETIEQAIKVQFEAGLIADANNGYVAIGSAGLYGAALAEAVLTSDRDGLDQPRNIRTLTVTTYWNFQP